MKKKGNKGKINETKVYVAVLVIIFAAAIIISVTRLGRDAAEPNQTPSPAPTEDVNAPGGSPADTTPAPEDTPEPTPTPTPTPRPTPTPQPTPTPAPTPTPTPPPADDLGTGSFSSNTGVGLDLVVDWAAGAAAEGGSSVTFAVSLSSYSLYTDALPGALTLTVGSETYTFDTPSVAYDGHSQITTPFATKTVTVPAGTVSVKAEWYYRGTYSGQYLESITASGTVDAG